jgi:thiamine biosynthesis lipoprotein
MKTSSGSQIPATLLLMLAAMPSVLPADEPVPARFAQRGLHMGVEFEIVLYAHGQQQADAAFERAFARIAALDRTMSDYDPVSELSRLSETSTVPPGTGSPNPPATAQPIKLTDDLWKVLEYSQALSRKSDGAFDVTVGPLTKLWRRARRQNELPSPERLAEARAAVGYELLQLDSIAHTAQLKRANMRLDLGGIAKGFAADEALAELKRAGISRALVRASGDIAAGEAPPGEEGWRIGIAPLDPDDPPIKFVRLANRAISTSGDSRQHLVIDGRRYSHIIDPRTGQSVSGRSSVSVIAPTAMQSDALATAVSVLGPEKGARLIDQFPDVALYMIAEDEAGQQRIVKSNGFADFEETKENTNQR